MFGVMIQLDPIYFKFAGQVSWSQDGKITTGKHFRLCMHVTRREKGTAFETRQVTAAALSLYVEFFLSSGRCDLD